MKIQPRILWHFQRLIKVVSTLNHKVETTLNRHWNVGWETWVSNDRCKIRLYVLAWNFWKSTLISVKHLSLSIYQVSSSTLYHSARRLIADSPRESAAKLEQIIAIVATFTIFLFYVKSKKSKCLKNYFFYEQKLYQKKPGSYLALWMSVFHWLKTSVFRNMPNNYRSSHSHASFKIGFPKNFANFAAKHLSWSHRGIASNLSKFDFQHKIGSTSV